MGRERLTEGRRPERRPTSCGPASSGDRGHSGGLVSFGRGPQARSRSDHRVAPGCRAPDRRDRAASTRLGTWREHIERVQDLADRLGLNASRPEPLDILWEALEDQAVVLEGLGRGGRSMSFEAFASELDAIVSEVAWEDRLISSGSVVVTTVDRARGARARHILLVNLAEGTFPSRESVESSLGQRAAPAYAREAASFLRVIGSADESIDARVSDARREGPGDARLGLPQPLASAVRAREPRGDPRGSFPVRPGTPESSRPGRAPADARARAVALACSAGDPLGLAGLATDPRHRPDPPRGCRGARARASEDREDGRILARTKDASIDADVVESVATRFNSEAAFSPSQLETYLACPFRFFMQYVMKLEPVKDHDDLAEDSHRARLARPQGPRRSGKAPARGGVELPRD